MTIIVNGTSAIVPSNASIFAVVCQFSSDPPPSGIAVAHNMDVVPRSKWQTTYILENDEIEILWASSGG